MTEDERRILLIEARVRRTFEDGDGKISKADFETLLASRLAWKFTAKCFSAAEPVQEALIREAAEHVRHAPDCPAIGGNGDKYCNCGAVAYLTRLFEAHAIDAH